MSIQFTDKMKSQAQTRMWVKWKYLINGYPDMIYHSFETKRSLASQDINHGLNGLIKLIKSEKLAGKFLVAIIYDCRTDQEIMRFYG